MEDEELTAHQSASDPCELRPNKVVDGLTAEQKKQLKPRDKNNSEEQKWIKIYKICFPNDTEIPSPCKYIISDRRKTVEITVAQTTFTTLKRQTTSYTIYMQKPWAE